MISWKIIKLIIARRVFSHSQGRLLNKDVRSKFGRCSPATRPFAYAGSTSVRRLPTKCGTLKGVPNKVTAEVKAIAQEHGPEAFKRLVKIIKSGTSEAVSQGSSRPRFW